MSKPKVDSKTCFIYNTEEFKSYLKDVKISPYMNAQITSTPQASTSSLPLGSEAPEHSSLLDTLYCSYCSTGFIDKIQQRAHYKLDWHRYNLNQHLANKKAISEEKFSQLVDDGVSSISGSESSDNEDIECDQSSDKEAERRLSHLIARRSRILFNNEDGKVISIHRCLLLGKKEKEATDGHLVQLIQKLPFKTTWMIVMLGGGHFAAAIFKGGEPILHKTFHSYTVRGKQGGTQSSKDNKGTHAKSAGASLRRYNELSMQQHVQELVKNWGPDINKCDLIFYRAVGRGNSGIIFSGSHPLCIKTDPRLRKVPFTTNRATFNEVKRVHEMLSSAFIYESNEMFKTTFSSPRPIRDESEEKWKKKKDEEAPIGSPKKIDRGKERPSPVRELPDIVQHLAAISTSGSEGDLSFIMDESAEEISFLHLKEFDDSIPRHIKDKVAKKKPKKKKKDEKDALRPELQQFWKKIHGACQMGDLNCLKTTLEEKDKIELTDEEVTFVLNQANICGETILHNMASEGHLDTVRLLMLHGADPCLKDKKSQTPYDHAPDKNTRNAFRRFMGEYPEMHDYSKSHIPSALTDEIEAEIAEKRKAAKKAKRVRDKEKKIEKEEKKKEEDEKQRFLNLSDREKMALAAEKRILNSTTGGTHLVINRCYSCAADMTGKVPFEYENYRFCTMPCLKAHRMKGKQL